MIKINNKYEHEIVSVLLCIGIRNSGYEYFKTALMILLTEDPTIPRYIELYKRVAKIYNVNPACVEHAMRQSILRSYNNSNIFILNTLIGERVVYERPNVSNLLDILKEYLKVFRKCQCKTSA